MTATLKSIKLIHSVYAILAVVLALMLYHVLSLYAKMDPTGMEEMSRYHGCVRRHWHNHRVYKLSLAKW